MRYPLSSILRLRSRESAEAKNMADLDAVGGRLAVEVNEFLSCKAPEILHTLNMAQRFHFKMLDVGAPFE